MENKFRIYEGISLKNLYRIEGISWYNNNYYVGFKRDNEPANDLLFVESDDDNTSEVYLVKKGDLVHIGYCYTSEENKIRLGRVIFKEKAK